MKKKVLVFFLCLGTISGFLAASPAAINFDNLPKDKSFEQYFVGFLNEYDTLRYPVIKKDDGNLPNIETAQVLYKTLRKIKKPNYDESLLKFLVARCLYNYDKVDSSEVESQYADLEKNHPEKAEHHWIYANYLQTTIENVKALDQFETYMKMKNYSISTFFIEDYAYSNFSSGKPLSAYYALTNGGTIQEKDVRNSSLYNIIKKSILESSSSEIYENDQVWRLTSNTDDSNYIYSTMLGISLPIKNEWNVKYQAFDSKRPALVVLNPREMELEGEKIGISVLVMAFPKKIFTHDIEAMYAKMVPVINKETKTIKNNEFSVYTFEDKTKYQDKRNGSLGYIYCTTVTPKVFSGDRCEHTIDFRFLGDNQSDGEKNEARYFHMKEAYKRLDEPITVLIFVDSCNALAKETEAWLTDFIQKSIFE